MATTLVLGGTGFIGRRLVPLLAQRGEEIVCMDINPRPPRIDHLGKQVQSDARRHQPVRRRHGGMVDGEAGRGWSTSPITSAASMPPRVAFKLNILGMDNCFEAARLRRRQPGRLCQLVGGQRRAEDSMATAS